MKPRIYLAGPYTHKDLTVQEERGKEHCKNAVKLLKAGHLVYSPIAETMNLAKYGELIGTTWDTWREKDQRELSLSDEMWIMTLDGWAQSVGVRGEVKYCIINNIPIFLYDTNLQACFEITVDGLLRRLGVTLFDELND